MRLVPCAQILEDLQESCMAPTLWLRFSSWTAATTAYTASKSRAEESCGGKRRKKGKVTTLCIDAHTCRDAEFSGGTRL